MPNTLEGRTIAAAVAGGVASVAGGVEFANGAVSAAFVHLFNNELSNLTHNVKAGDDPRFDPAVMHESRAVGLSLNDWCSGARVDYCWKISKPH